MVLKSPKVGFQQPKYSLGIQCVHARRPQTDYEALLPLHKTSRFGDMLLNTAKVIFEAHRGRAIPLGNSGFLSLGHNARLTPYRGRNGLPLIGHE
jgi:hypothetical protein